MCILVRCACVSDCPFELYSDLTSRLKYVNRVLLLMLIFGPLSLLYVLRVLLASAGQIDGFVVVLLPLLAANLLCTWGCWKLCQTRKKLKAQQQIHE